ncbi:MAG TPA: DUF6702 family protein [Chitinophagaceae bacterium]|nr:DUF6702 family protein [Chitinophagaceae bacterium]
MVASIDKWLSFSWLVCLAGFWAVSGPGHQPEGRPAPHPFHVSVAEFTHKAPGKLFEISCRVFVDDFESALAARFKTKIDLQGADKAGMDKLVKAYIQDHLQLNVDGKAAPLVYVGYEVESESVYIYLEADRIETVHTVVVTDSVLFDLYNDQISIVHAIVGGKRQSLKLDYPAQQARFQF